MPLYDNWTWDSVNRIMTIVADDVKGFDEANAYSLSDIPDCIVAKGWDASYNESTSGNQLEFNFRIVVGNGATVTWFVDTGKHITFRSAAVTASGQVLIDVKVNGTVRFGVLDDATQKVTSDGVNIFSFVSQASMFYIKGVANGEFYLYSCVFNSSSGSHRILISPNCRIYNCIVENCFLMGLTTANSSDLFNVILSECGLGTGFGGLNYLFGLLNKITAYRNDQVFYFGAQAVSVTVKNVYTRLCTNLVRAVSMAAHNYLVNADSDNWTIVWVGTDYNKYVYRQYEFDVTCIDKEGNPVEGVTAVAEYVSPYGVAFTQTTDAGGQIPTQTIDHGFFKYATGSTEQLKTPLKVTYSKAGYKTLVKYYPLNERTKDRAVMQKIVDIVFIDGKPALNLSETDSDNELYMAL